MIVALAILFGPERPRIRHAPIILHHGPGPRQRMVDDRDLVMGVLGIGLVDEDPLLDDRLIVLVQRKSAAVKNARAAKAAGLHLEHVVAAVALAVDPFADGITQ